MSETKVSSVLLVSLGMKITASGYGLLRSVYIHTPAETAANIETVALMMLLSLLEFSLSCILAGGSVLDEHAEIRVRIHCATLTQSGNICHAHVQR
jgi:hypothetical protein